jgi:hypothetical protein
MAEKTFVEKRAIASSLPKPALRPSVVTIVDRGGALHMRTVEAEFVRNIATSII